MRSPSRATFVGLAFSLLFPLLAREVAAYDHPLSDIQVREAYFLGTDSARSAQFLSSYVHPFQPANPGSAYVAQIEVRTPYAQVVIKSRQQIGYSAVQAEEDYKQSGDTLQVRVQILYPATQFRPVQPSPACAGAHRMNDALACFGDFRFRFTQGKPVPPATTYGTPIYSVGDGSIFIGGDVWFIFPAAAVSSAPLRVTVTQSGAQRALATFDLSRLL